MAAAAVQPTLEELELQHVLDHKRSELQHVAVQAGREWLAPAAATEHGTEQLFSALEREFQRPEFEEALARSQHDLQQQRQQLQGGSGGGGSIPAGGSSAAAAGAGGAPAAADGMEVLSQDWWELKENGELRASRRGTTVLVERDDVVKALASFIAEYIVSLPEANSMEPRQLQQAVALTMAELRKGRVRRLLDWGKLLYRLGAVGYGAFSMCTNPWVAKAVLAALWSCLRLMGRFVLPL
ncbi:hypothetical protein COHA_009504 [Chlorella ohadii]|uniref:Uncharacterized protein n=1 Tax=Chlorella ohadii TaxID=2649997 RepID=A0AAD5DI09_9CHLO|nr:hypothetical protein COHA_009504 [Chlorella ohadii]